MNDGNSGRARATMEGQLALFEGLERVRVVTHEIDQAIVMTRLGETLDPDSRLYEVHTEMREVIVEHFANLVAIAGQLEAIAEVLCHPDRFEKQ
jgi:CBS domain-containing protein